MRLEALLFAFVIVVVLAFLGTAAGLYFGDCACCGGDVTSFGRAADGTFLLRPRTYDYALLVVNARVVDRKSLQPLRLFGDGSLVPGAAEAALSVLNTPDGPQVVHSKGRGCGLFLFSCDGACFAGAPSPLAQFWTLTPAD